MVLPFVQHESHDKSLLTITSTDEVCAVTSMRMESILVTEVTIQKQNTAERYLL